MEPAVTCGRFWFTEKHMKANFFKGKTCIIKSKTLSMFFTGVLEFVESEFLLSYTSLVSETNNPVIVPLLPWAEPTLWKSYSSRSVFLWLTEVFKNTVFYWTIPVATSCNTQGSYCSRNTLLTKKMFMITLRLTFSDKRRCFSFLLKR